MKGFDHESPMSTWTRSPKTVWPGVLDRVPEEFSAFLTEPAFNLKDTTFCIWRRSSDSAWHHGQISFPEGADPDGSENLLWLLDGSPVGYAKFAHDYFEKSVDAETISQVFKHQPLTPELVAKLNSERDFAEVIDDAEEIGYTLSGAL